MAKRNKLKTWLYDYPEAGENLALLAGCSVNYLKRIANSNELGFSTKLAVKLEQSSYLLLARYKNNSSAYRYDMRHGLEVREKPSSKLEPLIRTELSAICRDCNICKRG